MTIEFRSGGPDFVDAFGMTIDAKTNRRNDGRFPVYERKKYDPCDVYPFFRMSEVPEGVELVYRGFLFDSEVFAEKNLKNNPWKLSGFWVRETSGFRGNREGRARKWFSGKNGRTPVPV